MNSGSCCTNKMKTLKIFAILFMAIFALASVSAASVTTSLFYDDTTENSISIYDGDSTGIIISADSIFEDSMTINVDILDSKEKIVANLLNVYTIGDSYSNHMLVGKNAYSKPGVYTIRSTVTAASGQADTDEIYLEVIPVPIANSAPSITSSPLIEINESQAYSYQVVATDSDGDAISYSLTQSPSWLSISTNGLISGVAPQLTSDYVYAVTIKVSDGKDFAIQSFALTVKDTNQGGDTTNPFITINSPENGATYNANTLTFRISINEAVSRAWYVIAGDAKEVNLTATGATSFEKNVVLLDGNYNVEFYAKDIAGNVGTAAVSFTIDTTIPDTTSPLVTAISPREGRIYSSSAILFGIISNENINAAWYSLDNGADTSLSSSNSITWTGAINAAEGTHTIVFYGRDISGNVGVSNTITFSVDLEAPDTTSPTISVISPLNNQIYTSSDIFLSMTSSEQLSAAWYSLDNSANVSLIGDGITWQGTITAAEGTHTIVFYGEDLAGNVGTAIVSFAVDLPSSGDGDNNKKKTIFISNPDDDNNYLNQFATKTAGDEVIDVSPAKELSFWQKLWNWIKNFVRWVFG